MWLALSIFIENLPEWVYLEAFGTAPLGETKPHEIKSEFEVSAPVRRRALRLKKLRRDVLASNAGFGGRLLGPWPATRGAGLRRAA